DIRSPAVGRDNPEFNSAVEIRIARFVRTGVAEVAHGYASGVDALLVHQVIARVVGAGERDAYALGRVTMAVDEQGRPRILLHPERDLIQTRLVLVRDPRRIEREEDRTTWRDRRSRWWWNNFG